MKKWNGPIKPAYIELPEDLHHAMRAFAIETGRKAAAVYIEAANAFLERGKSQHIKRSGRKSTLIVAGIDEAVLESIRTHQDDPRCTECILALGRIWETGDEDVKNAITHNCRVFSRVSEALKGQRDGTSEAEVGHEGRVGGLLEDEARSDAQIDDPEATDSDPRGSGGGMSGMGAQSAGTVRKRG